MINISISFSGKVLSKIVFLHAEKETVTFPCITVPWTRTDVRTVFITEKKATDAKKKKKGWARQLMQTFVPVLFTYKPHG